MGNSRGDTEGTEVHDMTGLRSTCIRTQVIVRKRKRRNANVAEGH